MTLVKIAWRNLFRQRRRTLITASAMGLSLLIAIPTYGLMEGLSAQMLRGITRMEIGHVQLHDPAYPRSKALQSTLRRPEALLRQIRSTPDVLAAAPRVHGYGLASHETRLKVALLAAEPAGRRVRFGRSIAPGAPWRRDLALACEALVRLDQATQHSVTVGTVLTAGQRRSGNSCERIRIVGILERAASAPGAAAEGRLEIFLAAEDLQQAFGSAQRSAQATLMHSAAVALAGVDPVHERRVTFMSEKIVEGRYLEQQPRREIVVGYRLAKVMRLGIGDKVFIQASTLDYSSNTYYQDFEIVGIYRTGVEMIDRSRVFLHLGDAQRLMGLEQRVHEIALVGPNARDLEPLVARLRQRVGRTRLEVTTQRVGRRAGSTPLPAPVTVFEPTPDRSDSALLIPYDLKRRFDTLEGVQAIARRVYAQTEVSPAHPVSATVRHVEAGRLPPAARAPCHVLVDRELAKRWSLNQGAILLPWPTQTASLDHCPQLVAHIGSAAAGEAASGAQPTLLAAKRKQATTNDEGIAPLSVPTGSLRLLAASTPTRTRVAGVEPVHERALCALHTKLAAGTYLTVDDHDEPAALLPQRLATKLQVQLGARLLLRSRDDEGQTRWRPVRVAGLLRDSDWPTDLPQLLLPYFAAQQIDAPRLNARAHEMLLLPTSGTPPTKLAQRTSKELAPLVRSWQHIAPDMAKLISTQDAWTGVFLLIIFAIAAMTVMNTMLMAVFERTKEFGVLKSIGMRPWQVFSLITLETLSLALVSVLAGGGLGAALNHYLMTHGLDLSSYTGGFTYQGTFVDPVWRSLMTVRSVATPSLMVAIVCLAVSFYPAARAGRLRPVEALRDRL